ncbi:DUF2897 family protein [Catenovulum agarivorans]|uniref:DUF2897 family protein n=1 Tax=Catenovulum agarivorans TaxID=1172192 RepID=UPI0004BBBED5|nr:DUF2897 family protein [Catenovulum agarivorans]
MSNWMIVGIIVLALLFIIGPLVALTGSGKFKIPKDFKNTQGYDQDKDKED